MTLRELVAVEVMGDKPEVSQQVSNDGGKSSAFGNDDWSTRHIDIHAWLAEKQARGLMTDYKVVEWKRYPAYDTNIADAWRVVEKMQTFASGSVERERFEYAFAGLRLDTASSQQAASAICIIALRACGVSEDRIEQARKGSI